MVRFPTNTAYIFPLFSKLNTEFLIIAKEVSSYLKLLLSKKRGGEDQITFSTQTQKTASYHTPKFTIRLYSLKKKTKNYTLTSG